MSNIDQDQRTETQGTQTGMQPVRCTECLTRVLVRKSVWAQTSVKWTEEALDLCRERPASAEGNLPRDQFVGCETLRAAIRDATVQGSLELADQEAP